MVGLIDCDNFFCSCERVFRPDLNGRPVVVLSNNDGCVVARSREAKGMGIPEGLPYFQLMQQYPHAGIVAFSSNYALYGDLSARVLAVLADEVPQVTQYSIDEAFLDLEGMDSETIADWGRQLCRKVVKCTGIPVSLGIASTKTLAKVASKFAKRYPAYNKCCHIATETQRRKALSLFPASDVWGIGRRMTRKLEYYGVHTALDYAQRSRSWIRSQFHITGERTWRELNGQDVINIDGLDAVARQTIVTSRSFPGMITDADDLAAHVANYAARCAVKLRRQHTVCAIATVFMQSNHFRPDLQQYNASASCRFANPTAATNEIVEGVLRAMRSIFRPGIHYKRAGVMVAEITPDSAIQTNIFGFDADIAARNNRLSAALDSINRRLGADTVVLGAQQYRDRGDDGKSLQFVNAIRRAMKSPDYTTRLGAFTVG